MRQQGSRILRRCCFTPLPHSCITSVCLISGRCPTSAASAPAEHCSPPKRLSKTYPASLLLSKQLVTWSPTYICLFLPPPWHWDSMNFWSSLYFPHQLPFYRTAASSSVHWLFQPASCLALISDLIPFFSPNHFCNLLISFEFSSCWPNIIAVPPSSVTSINLISILPIPSSRLLMEV